jgi:hypothetical protein
MQFDYLYSPASKRYCLYKHKQHPFSFINSFQNYSNKFGKLRTQTREKLVHLRPLKLPLLQNFSRRVTEVSEKGPVAQLNRATAF